MYTLFDRITFERFQNQSEIFYDVKLLKITILFCITGFYIFPGFGVLTSRVRSSKSKIPHVVTFEPAARAVLFSQLSFLFLRQHVVYFHLTTFRYVRVRRRAVSYNFAIFYPTERSSATFIEAIRNSIIDKRLLSEMFF